MSKKSSQIKLKIIVIIFLLVVINILNCVSSNAHSGRTDSKGGHYVRKEGTGYPLNSYHYHNGGSTSSSSNKSTRKSTYAKPKITANKISTIKYGEEESVLATISNSSTNTYTITSSNPSVIFTTGTKIKAVGIGTSYITISSTGAESVWI